MIEVGIGIGIMIIAASIGKAISSSGKRGGLSMPSRKHTRISAQAHKQALEVYERLAREKLDVIRTALAMGYSQDDITRLDARLERLIGKEQLEQLAAGYAPVPSAELESVNLTDEVRRLKEARTTR